MTRQILWRIALLSFLTTVLFTVLSNNESAWMQEEGFIVDSTDDAIDVNPGDGTCATALGVCTLRAAIQEANALPRHDTITLPSGIYALSISGIDEGNAVSGDLDITDDLTINGAGADDTTIDGNRLDRVFHIIGASSVEITGVTIEKGGNTSEAFILDGQHGGAIFNSGTLVLTDVTVRDNLAVLGGGIFNEGSATLTNVTLTENTSSSGAIFNDGMLTLTSSTVTNNAPLSFTGGGGIVNPGTAVLTNVTVSGNKNGHNGGIVNSGSLTITNSTIAENGAATLGAGIRNSDGTVTVRNMIVASNSGHNCAGNITSTGHNLEDADTCGFNGPTDLTNTDPLLGPLQDNGGPTLTHALLPGSPAIDAGDNTGCPASDQRGVSRPQDGNGDGIAVCDIGAFELQAMEEVPLVADRCTPVSNTYSSPTLVFPTLMAAITPPRHNDTIWKYYPAENVFRGARRDAPTIANDLERVEFLDAISICRREEPGVFRRPKVGGS